MATLLVIIGVTGSLAGIISLLYFMYPPFRRFSRARLPSLLGVKYAIPWTMDDVNRAIEKASDRVSILQTWVPSLNSDIGRWQNTNEKVPFRILLATDSIAEARTKYRQPCIPLNKHNVAVIKNFSHGESPRITLRHYDGLPFGPIYIVDDTIYWGIYLSHLDSMLGPQFISSRDSIIGKMIEQSFDKIWSSETLKASLPSVLDDELQAPK